MFQSVPKRAAIAVQRSTGRITVIITMGELDLHSVALGAQVNQLSSVSQSNLYLPVEYPSERITQCSFILITRLRAAFVLAETLPATPLFLKTRIQQSAKCHIRKEL